MRYRARHQSQQAFTQPECLCRLLLLTEFFLLVLAMKVARLPDEFPDLIKESEVCCAAAGEFLPVA